MSDSLIGRTLGKYQILDKLGQGGMGLVFKALQPSLNRTVAIKVLPAQLAMDPEFVHRFRQEAQVIASLQHESIVHVYDIDEAVLASGEKLYFIVMELVDGQTLRQWAGRRPLPAHEVARIGGELARALDYAHQRGIVHRDVKAANAMVTRDARVKLMDFGIAKSAGGVHTMTGSVLGTPEYMAPEQARSGKVTAQSDIYSLGVLLYELATGRMPFTGEDAFSIALQHLSQEPPRPREVNAAVPEWLERIILRAMAKEPSHRYSSAGQLATDLRAGSPESPAAAAPSDPGAPTLAAGAVPGWPPTPSPYGVAAASWPPQAGSPGNHLPTTPIGVAAFGASPPGPNLPPTPPGSYPPPTGAGPSSAPPSAPGWGAAGAYVPPTPSPAPPGWMPPAPAGTWPPSAGPAPAATPLYPTAPGAQAGPPPPSPPAAAPAQANLPKAVGVLGFLALMGLGIAIGGFLGRKDKPEPPAVQVAQPGTGPEAPPPPPERERGEEPPLPAPRPAPPTQPVRPAPAPPVYPPPSSGPAQAPTEVASPAEAGPTPGELWSQAYQLKEQKKYHSLRQVLDRLMAKDPDYADARDWRGDVDGWVEDREGDLRGETEDLLDELIDALGDRDADHLADQWGGRLDGASRATADELWSLGPRLKWTARLRTFKPFDDRANFGVVIEVTERGGRKLRELTWNGTMADDKDGVRFTSPLR